MPRPSKFLKNYLIPGKLVIVVVLFLRVGG